MNYGTSDVQFDQRSRFQISEYVTIHREDMADKDQLVLYKLLQKGGEGGSQVRIGKEDDGREGDRDGESL